MDLILNWLLRATFVVVGLGAGLWIFRWLAHSWRHAEERWPVRIALGMLGLAVLYGAGHARLLIEREKIEAGRAEYVRFGDPRRTEMRRAEVRGWIYDCTGQPEHAFAVYRESDGVVQRTYPIGEAGANFVGGGVGADERDFTIERLFAARLREPMNFQEAGELHPAGTDLRLSLCSGLTAEAWQLLRQTNRRGAVVVQDVQTGALLAYAATGGPEDAPFGIKRYAPPGSVFKLALAALWWDHGLPDDITIPCPASIQVTPRASIQNYEGRGIGTVNGPTGMLVPSCNTAAVWMALQMRERLGPQAFVEAYDRYGFETYPSPEQAPRDTTYAFWATHSRPWSRRMTPPPSRIRISETTGLAEWGQLSIGQGPVDVTVIGVSRFLQAIGNGGVMVSPKLEWEAIENGRGAGDRSVRVMNASTAVRLQRAMLAVVDRGTAVSAQPVLQGLRWDMGGKTGTAQIPGRPDDGWFAGLVFDPEGRARYTVVAYLEAGGPGSRMPVSIAARLARSLAQANVTLVDPEGEE